MRIPFQVAVGVVGVVACTVLHKAVRCEIAGSRIRHLLEPVAGTGIVVVESQVVDLPFLPGAAVEVQAAAGDGLEVSAFVVGVDALGVSADFLMNGSTDEQAVEALSDIELLRQFKKVEQLPNDKKAVVKELIDAFLLKHDIQQKFA